MYMTDWSISDATEMIRKFHDEGRNYSTMVTCVQFVADLDTNIIKSHLLEEYRKNKIYEYVSLNLSRYSKLKYSIMLLSLALRHRSLVA